jgi:F-type H+-transporting ATPase subunit epsilon
MASTMQVSLVAADREVWSGKALVVNASTVSGEIGILANHTPVLSVLAAGEVEVVTEDDKNIVVAIDGGFVSVANNEVRLLCENAEISLSGSYSEAKRKLDERLGASGGA